MLWCYPGDHKCSREDVALQKNLLIIGDPLPGLSPKGDTSLALAQGALQCGWKVLWTEAERIVWTPAEVCGESFSEIVSFDGRMPKVTAHLPSMGLQCFDLIMIRKDPPVDEGYRNLCLLLGALPHKIKAKVQNDPFTLLHTHEKLLPFQMVEKGALSAKDVVPSLFLPPDLNEEQVAQRIEQLQAQTPDFNKIYKQDSWILKPWLGFAGKGVQKINGKQNVAEALQKQNRFGIDPQVENSKTRINWQESLWILQPYLPQIISHGDRRVLVAQGQVVCDIVRYAAEGSLAANLAQGGTAKLEPLNDALHQKCEAIAGALLKMGVAFAGLDIIGEQFTEINITSPTGLRAYEDLSGKTMTEKTFALLAQGL
jgi:glutathione synthase